MDIIYISIIFVLLIIIIISHITYGKKKIKLENPRILVKGGKDKISNIKTQDEYQKIIWEILLNSYKLGDFGKPNTILAEGCIYALEGGKRIRSILALEIIRSLGENIDGSEVVIIIECIQAASLIIDDLPQYDDSNMRRGKKTLHNIYDLQTVGMIVVCLVTTAFKLIGNLVNTNIFVNRNAGKLHNMFRLVGSDGMALGQYLDTRQWDQLMKTYGDNALQVLIHNKTSSFFQLSFIFGWIAGGGNIDKLEKIEILGEKFGTTFQISDDIKDMDTDKENKKLWNYALIKGKDRATIDIKDNINNINHILDYLGLKTEIWREVITNL